MKILSLNHSEHLQLYDKTCLTILLINIRFNNYEMEKQSLHNKNEKKPKKRGSSFKGRMNVKISHLIIKT